MYNQKIVFILTKAAGDNFILLRLISSLPKEIDVVVYIDKRYDDIAKFFSVKYKIIHTPARYRGLIKILTIFHFYSITYVRCLFKKLCGYKIILPFGDYYELFMHYLLFKSSLIKCWNRDSVIRKVSIVPNFGHENIIYKSLYDEFLFFFKKHIYRNAFYVTDKNIKNKSNDILICSKGSQEKKILSEKLILNIIKNNKNKNIYVDFHRVDEGLIKINCTLIEYIKLIGRVGKVYTVESLCQHVASYYGVECNVYPGGGEPEYFIAPGNHVIYNNKPQCFPCYNNKTIKCNFECLVDED